MSPEHSQNLNLNHLSPGRVGGIRAHTGSKSTKKPKSDIPDRN